MKPEICVVSPLYHPNLGGLGRQAQLLSERIRKEGIPVFVISRRMSRTPEAVYSPDVPIIRIPSIFAGKHILEEISLKNLLISMRFSLGLIAALIRNRKRFNIAHFHGASLPLFASIPVLKILRKRIVAKVAAANLGTEAGSLSGRYWGLGSLLARMVRGVDAFIAISDEIREGLIRDGIPGERIHRINNFVDGTLFYPPAPNEKHRLKEALGFDNRTLVVSSGRLVPRKGIDVLLRGWREVSRKFPEALLLVLGDGPSDDQLKTLATELGISRSVAFLGRVDTPWEYLRAGDLFVLPSLQEGMPNSVLEAMACGLPVIATRIGGVTDIVTDRENGLLFPPGDHAVLSEYISAMLSDAEARVRIGSSGSEAIGHSFGLEARIGPYKEIYNRVLNHRQADMTQ